MTPRSAADVEARVRAALDAVKDPCSQARGAPAGLAEFGLVCELVVEPRDGGWAAELAIRLTDPGCLLGAELVRAAREAVSALPELTAVDVRLSHDHGWTEADMAPAARARLEAMRDRRRRAHAATS